MKLTKKQIEIVKEMTRQELKGTQRGIVRDLGYYMPSNANWSYHVGWDYEGNLICTRFGEVM